MSTADRIAALRALMEAHGLSAYLVPSTDPHLSEYPPDRWKRREFLSGFDGSAGTVVVTATDAGLWTDSRYFLQAEQQLDGSVFRLFRQGEPDVPEIDAWLAQTLKSGDRVGMDPSVLSISAVKDLKNTLDPVGIELVETTPDLVDRVWGDSRPTLPSNPVVVHPLEHAGERSAQKVARLRAAMRRRGADAHVICALDQVAWLFNLRGSDVKYNRVFLACAVVEHDRVALFANPEATSAEVRSELPAGVGVLPYGALKEALEELGRNGRTVWLDPDTTNRRVATTLESGGATLLLRGGPLPAWKAAKNAQEIAGMRAAHRRDGIAMVRFLRWLEQAVPDGGVTELSAAGQLDAFRAAGDRYIGPSFETIAAYGPNGAVVHYRVTEETSLRVEPNGLFLVDSGGQYVDGTTDVTRTLALGKPGREHVRAYTAVLKGHLALTRALFPVSANGYQLDVLARAPLWANGMDYGHGTGHGVGASLCVHEGPFSVSLRKNMTPLQPGNILSIEPGFYRTDGWGIRIENLALAVERDRTHSGLFMGFETLTLCPYQLELIDPDLLSPEERNQINVYHTRVRETLSSHLDNADRQWLDHATRSL